ncbi:MAG TPA: GntR family transcriptional regulator [Gaiellaceae bacterium]|nr:GntR family transcriptional regulator [Gaiellaceae bacterium]
MTSLDNQQTRDLYLARRAIERAAVETLTKDPTPEQLSRLNELLARMQRAAGRNRWADLASLDLAFHEALVAATESKRLVRMFRTLIVETSICVAALKPAYPHLKTLVEEHETLLQAIERGDTKRALQLVDEHLESAVRDLTTRSPS